MSDRHEPMVRGAFSTGEPSETLYRTRRRIAMLLAACQGGTGNILDLGSPSLVVAVHLVGPKFSYPLQDAVVTVNGEKKLTGPGGRITFRGLTEGREYTATVKTDFAEVTQTARIGANTVWTVPMPLPEIINDDVFINSLFWDNTANFRWERGSTVTVFFDYSRGENMPLEERTAAEAQALDEFEGWFAEADPEDPYLIWGGQVVDKEDANVIVYMMHDEAFYERFPQDRPDPDAENPTPRVAGRGGFQPITDGEYPSGGTVWIRVDCCSSNPGLYAHEIGHVLGFRHPKDLSLDDTVMSYSHIAGTTSVDRLMMKVKMHLPGGIGYNPAVRAMTLPPDLGPLPMDASWNDSSPLMRMTQGGCPPCE